MTGPPGRLSNLGHDRATERSDMTAQLVGELELPLLQTIGMERLDAIAAVEEARSQHWLARTDMGYCVTGLNDVTAILRDKRFHSALSILPEMSGLPELAEPSRRRKSILSMEGDEHARLRRLVAPAFTPLSATCTLKSTSTSRRVSKM